MPPKQANSSGGDGKAVTITKIVTTLAVAAVKIAVRIAYGDGHCPSWGWWPKL